MGTPYHGEGREVARRPCQGTPDVHRRLRLAGRVAGLSKVDGKEVASEKMEHTLSLLLQWDENFDT